MSGLSWTRSHFLGSSTARYAEGSDALEAAKAFADQHGAMLIFQTNPRVAKFGRAYVKQDDQPPQTPTEAIRFGLYLFASHPYRGGRCDPWWAAPSFFGQRRHLPSPATCLFPKT